MADEAHAIVVLGAAVNGDRPRPTLRARLDAAHGAFLAKRAPRIIVTGHGEAEIMRRYLEDRGVPADAIVLEREARTTLQNARHVAQLVPRGVLLLLVTQPFHQPRAQALFARAGLRTAPIYAVEHFNLYRAVRERIAYTLLRWIGEL